MSKSKYFTTKMPASQLGVSTQYLRKLIADNKIKAEKLGHDWLIDEKAVRQFKRQRSQKVKENTNENGMGSVNED